MLKSLAILRDLANLPIRAIAILVAVLGFVDTVYQRLPSDLQNRLAFLQGLPSWPMATWLAIISTTTLVLMLIAVTKKFGWLYKIEVELREDNFATSTYGLNYAGLRVHNASPERIYEVKPVVTEIITMDSGERKKHLNDELRWSAYSVAFALSKDADYQDQTILPGQSLVADVAYASMKPDKMHIRSRRGDLYGFLPGGYLIEIKVHGKYRDHDFPKPFPFYGLLSFPNGLDFELKPLTRERYDEMIIQPEVSSS